MDLATATEKDLREFRVETPADMQALMGVIEQLAHRDHDYGTCVYAMSIAATLHGALQEALDEARPWLADQARARRSDRANEAAACKGRVRVEPRDRLPGDAQPGCHFCGRAQNGPCSDPEGCRA